MLLASRLSTRWEHPERSRLFQHQSAAVPPASKQFRFENICFELILSRQKHLQLYNTQELSTMLTHTSDNQTISMSVCVTSKLQYSYRNVQFYQCFKLNPPPPPHTHTHTTESFLWKLWQILTMSESANIGRERKREREMGGGWSNF